MAFGDLHTQRAAWASLAVVLLAAFGYGGFVLGGHRCGGEGEVDPVLAADCEETDALAWARELDLTQVVEAGANEELRRTIKTLGDRIHSLEEEARFYRRLVAPADEDAGFSIERLDISKTRDPDRFAYTLVLTQAADQDQWVEGRFTVEVVGERENGRQSLSLAELSEESEYPIKFGLLYFEDFRGQMTLPDGFRPEEVRVAVEVDTGLQFERVFAWSAE